MRLAHYYLRLASVPLLLTALVLVACEPSGGTGGQSRATSVTVSPAFLSFDGTSTATIAVTANGNWTLASDSTWLKVSRTSGGAGTSSVTVTVDRAGLAAQHHAGELTLSGASPLETVTVSMRFPKVTGQVRDAEGRVTAGSRAPDVTLGAAAVDAAAAAEVIPGEYLVLLNDGMARALEARASGPALQSVQASVATFQAMASSLAADYGLSLSSRVRSAALPLMSVKADGAEAVARLASDGRVRFVEPRRRLVLPPIDATAIDVKYDFKPQWHYEHINLSGAWNVTQGEPTVVVAVIDGGFATWDYMLAPNLLPGYDFANYKPDPSAYSACTEHGTHVAGTIASTWNEMDNVGGVAPNVKVRPIRIGFEQTDGCGLDDSALFYALGYAAGYYVEGVPQIPPVDVINLSLGWHGYSDIFEAAIELVLAAGVSVVAAAGNDGIGTVRYPAAYDGVIGVSATNPAETLAYYSNYGPEIDVSAPGGDMRYDLDGDGWLDGVISLGWDLDNDRAIYSALQGTSMASPHVAAVVALMKSVNPDLDPASIALLLRSSARDLGPSGFDTSFGWGMVDAGTAVAMARDASRAKFSDVIVRLRDGGTIVASTEATASGAFDLGLVAAGTYVLEAGTDRNGDGSIDGVGEFYASKIITVSYTGDVVSTLDVDLR